MLVKVLRWSMGKRLSLGSRTEHDIGAGISHTGQYKALGTLFDSHARPFDFVANAAALQLADAGAARAVSAGTGPIAAAHFEG